MPISRRLTITFLSILLLTLIAGGLTQLVHAQGPETVQANIVWVNGPKATIQLQLFRSSPITVEQPVPGDTLRELDKTTLLATWDGVENSDTLGNLYTFTVNKALGMKIQVILMYFRLQITQPPPLLMGISIQSRTHMRFLK